MGNFLFLLVFASSFLFSEDKVLAEVLSPTNSSASEDIIHSMLSPYIGLALSLFRDLLHIQTPIYAKLILSGLAFVVAMSLRKLIVFILFEIVSFLLHLSNHDLRVKASISNGMLRPVVYILLVICIDIAIEVLYYPALPSNFIRESSHLVYIALGTWFSIVLLKTYGVGLMGEVAKKDGMRREAINLLLKVSYFLIFVIGFLIALRELGFNVSAILASLGIGGLAVAFALKDILANFFASVMLLFENSFSQGDWIECSGIEGTVVEIGLRRTVIRTFDNALVAMPNALLSDKSIINWTRRKMGRRIKFNIGLTYDSPAHKIKNVVDNIKNMLLNHPGIARSIENIKLDDYELALRKNVVSMEDYLGYLHWIYVALEELGDSSINISIYCYTKSVSKGEHMAVKEDVIFKIMKIVEEEGLSFAFPSQSLYVESLPKKADTFNEKD